MSIEKLFRRVEALEEQMKTYNPSVINILDPCGACGLPPAWNPYFHATLASDEAVCCANKLCTRRYLCSSRKNWNARQKQVRNILLKSFPCENCGGTGNILTGGGYKTCELCKGKAFG